ncbi:MAG: tail fiber domain-containing protein [Haliscomenobacter sp.]|uniref:tail fiber domain-containing protein n=1 Tax=Haliscomenobacter sp. TaxID=2717303 RepID=UPI0029B16B45|nr:tail fiber domain-containing protein [Haliscomenobacter sp.]MDX2072148.1 tail fiber domain-containing protein [Haliscomenobacter sp.]
MKNLLLLIIFALSFFAGHYGIAQVKVTSTGKTILGLERSGNDPSAQVTTEALGVNPSDGLRTKSRISFGDYGYSGSGEYIFLGEARANITGGGDDSDALHLHGSNGIYFSTTSTGAYVGMKLDVSGNLLVRGTLTQNVSTFSDIRLKKNILKIDSSLSILKKLNGIRYDFTPAVNSKYRADLDKLSPSGEKEKKALEDAKKSIDKASAPVTDQYGLSAQEVQKILPSIVSTSEDGYLAVNYTALIPILIEAVKSQQKQIEDLQKEVELLKKK